jgi:hypothetical protein
MSTGRKLTCQLISMWFADYDTNSILGPNADPEGVPVFESVSQYLKLEYT